PHPSGNSERAQADEPEHTELRLCRVLQRDVGDSLLQDARVESLLQDARVELHAPKHAGVQELENHRFLRVAYHTPPRTIAPVPSSARFRRLLFCSPTASAAISACSCLAIVIRACSRVADSVTKACALPTAAWNFFSQFGTNACSTVFR